MSMASVFPYFRTIMTTTLGHREWKDVFNDENIPATIIDRSYHLQLGTATNIKQNQDVIEFTVPLAVKLFVKGYRDVATGRDTAMLYWDGMLQNILKASTRLATYTGLKNVVFNGGGIAEAGDSNDNLIKITMNFTCSIMIATA